MSRAPEPDPPSSESREENSCLRDRVALWSAEESEHVCVARGSHDGECTLLEARLHGRVHRVAAKRPGKVARVWDGGGRSSSEQPQQQPPRGGDTASEEPSSSSAGATEPGRQSV